MAYNSNKIEGSTLTPEQTASLFDTGILPGTDDYYRAKDVDLSQKMIKHFHYELKSGVFEDRANGYAIGEYKERPNIISNVNILWDKNKD